jgi:hypothetical protein
VVVVEEEDVALKV